MSLLIMSDGGGEINEVGRVYDEGYNKGVNDAWEAAKALVLDRSRGGISYRAMRDMFVGMNTYQDILEQVPACEVVAKIKACREIKVGDEVYFADENHPRVVTSIFTDNGCNPKAVQITESGKYCVDDVTELKKTGRHFPQIAEVLGQLKGEQND